ncbi:retrovirus-related pol polyprotein from transposon TNT 1-94, partial [Tanacetum coccineum]
MDPYNHSTPTSTKLPILDIGKFEQWKFRIQQTTLLLALLDEHQLRFSKYDHAKELWEAILKTFGGNEATKKTKKNQLKQQYGNFKTEGSETLEQTFNRLQVIVSHLKFMDVPIKQDDLNQKFLTSLAPEWLVYTIVWRNRDDLDTMSLDDMYNHLKVYEPEVQKRAGSNSQNMAFISSSNTNSGKISTASTDVAAACLSYDTVCAFITTQSNGSQIKYEDISQIDDDDIEEMDIKWNALIAIRWAIFLESADHQGVKTEGRKKASRRILSYMAEEDETSKNHALVADEEEVPTECALMAKSSSSSDNEVYDDSFCSKSCRKNTENLNNKIIKLNKELSDCETDLYNYKRGLSQVEARLVEFKENEIKFCERIRVLKRDIEVRDNRIENLMNELEVLKKEKESIDFKIEKFGNASKDLDGLLGNQRLDKDKKGLGFNEYSIVPPPPAQVYSPPKKNLSWMGLPEFVDDIVTDYSRPTPSIDVSKDVSDEQKAIWKSNSASSFEQGGSFGNIVSKPMIRFVKETGCPSVSKVNNTKNSRKPTMKYAYMYMNTLQSPRVRGNQRNWNNQKSQQLGKDFVDKGKTWTRVDHDKMKYPSTPTLNSAYPKMTSFVEPAHSHVKRPFVRKSAVKNKVWVPTVRTNFPTVGSKVPTAKPTVAADKGNKGKTIKASACWIWKPKQTQLDQGSNLNGVSVIFKKYKYIDTQGMPKHMTGNISYMSKYKPFNGGYVLFGHGGGKITSKGTIKTGKLDVLFTDSECLVLGKDFKLVDDAHVLLRTPRQQNMYSIDLKNVVPHKNLTCLIAKVSIDESMLWHRRFTWTFFIKSKDETSSILRNFITEIENLKDLKVKIIRYDNRGEFRNKEMDEFCSRKGIKREFINARTPQQNGIAERRNRTLIEAARTMLADAKLPVT